MRIDVEILHGGVASRVLIDGEPAGTRRVVTSTQDGPLRHGVWIDGVPQYEVEVYLNDRLDAHVGPRTVVFEQAYVELGPPPTDDPAVGRHVPG